MASFLTADAFSHTARNRDCLDDRAGLSEAWSNAACFAALLAADVAALLLATAGAFAAPHVVRLLGFEPPVQVMTLQQLHAQQLEVSVIGICALFYCAVHAHYTRRRPFWAETRDVLIVSVLTLLIASFAELVFKGAVPRHLLLGLWLLFAPTAVLTRMAARSLLNHTGLWHRNVVVVGDAAGLAEASKALNSDRSLGYRLVRMIDQTDVDANLHPGHFRAILLAHRATRLVLGIDPTSPVGQRVARAVLRDRIPFSLIPRTAGLPVLDFERVAFFSHDTVLLSYRNNLANPVARGIKTCLDLTLGAVLLATLAVPMLVIAGLIRRDGGPALFRHERIGAGGRRFHCLKFRTMVVDADRVLQQALAADPHAAAEWRAHQKLGRDPRVTRLGRPLRISSLDELPQLLNVLHLEMSLVGPRPIVQQEVSRYGDLIADYFEARPGLTGLWQVSGRSDTDYDRRVELDSWYVRNWTAWHDIAIMIKTIPAVLARHGAR